MGNDVFFGDLKTSSSNQIMMPGNHKPSVYKVIEDFGRLWYIVYEHETKRDRDYNSEMAIARMGLMVNSYQECGDISYKSKMKHSVNFKKMNVLEINSINKHLLEDYVQGNNSNGNSRNLKIKLFKRDYDMFSIYSYEYE